MNTDIANLGLWQAAWRVAKLNMGSVLLYVVAYAGMEIAYAYMNSNSAITILQILAVAALAMVAHLTILRGITGLNALGDVKYSSLIVAFALRGLGLVLLASMATLLLFLVTSAAGFSIKSVVPFAAVLFLVSYTAVLAKWGTMLPAIVAGDNRSMKEAGVRGSLTIRCSFLHLLVPYAIFSAANFAATHGIPLLSAGDGKLFPGGGAIDFYVLIATLIVTVIGAFQIVMTAVILSRAYLAAGGKVSKL